MDTLDLCMGCMSLRDGAETCVRCGYTEGTRVESPLHLPPRTELFGQYLLGKVIGHGGFGITYLGWDKNLQRKLAVKEYFPSGVAMRAMQSPDVTPFSGQLQKDFDYGLERYLEEARLVARFNQHPNILSVLNFFRENGTAYIVMEFLDGVTLEKHIERMGGRITWEEALELMEPVMRALEEVHEGGIMHRDVSPDNIHIGKGRQVKLLDFGAARVALGERSRNLSVILKEGYAPSEQYRSKGNQGPWTDVYALAATLYRATTGVMPPPSLDRMTEDEMKPPRAYGVEMHGEQERVLVRALAFDPKDRFQSMKEFRESLLAERDRPVPSSITPVPERKPLVPAWVWSIVGALVVLGVLAAIRPKAEPPAPFDYNQALARAQVSTNPAEATSLLEAAIAAAPKRPEAHDLLGQTLLYASGNPAQAAAHFARALELGGFANFRVSHEHGEGKLRLGRGSVSFVDDAGVRTFTTLKDDVEQLRKEDTNVPGLIIKLKGEYPYRFTGTSSDKQAERDIIVELAGEK